MRRDGSSDRGGRGRIGAGGGRRRRRNSSIRSWRK